MESMHIAKTLSHFDIAKGYYEDRYKPIGIRSGSYITAGHPHSLLPPPIYELLNYEYLDKHYFMLMMIG